MKFSKRSRRPTRGQCLALLLGSVVFILWCGSGNEDSWTPARSNETNLGDILQTTIPYEVRKDGLVDVDLEKEHPILVLMRNAEQKWEDLHRRQSKTLQEAVTEYKRRNGYPPPAGFDAWWDFVQKHKVVLVDEFDQINYDVTPFLALSPQMFRERVNDPSISAESKSWHFAIKNSQFYRYGPRWWFGNERGLASMLMGFSRILPNLTMHGPEFTRADDWIGDDYRKAAAEKVKNETHFTRDEVARYESIERNTRQGISNICDDDAPVLGQRLAYSQPKFIADHLTYANPCKSKNIQYAPPLLFRPGARRPRLTPYFAFHKHTPATGFLLPTNTWELYEPILMETKKWSERTSSKLYWRGPVVGWNWYIGLRELRESEGIKLTWKDGARPKFALMFNEKVDPDLEVNVLLEKGGNQTGLTTKKYKARWLNEKWMDVGLTGRAIQCNAEEGTCAEMESEHMWKQERDKRMEGSMKFVVDLDSNDWSEEFQRKLAYGNVVLKATAFPEWNSAWLVPWLHYIPIQATYSDVYNIMAFFLGDPERGQGGHDELAAKISEHASEFAKKYWRWQDMQAYLFRLMLEYSRLLSDDREAASFKL